MRRVRFLVALLPIQGILAIDIAADAVRDGGWRSVIRETGEGFRYLWS